MIQNNPWGLPKTVEIVGKKTKENIKLMLKFVEKNYLVISKEKWFSKLNDYYICFNKELGYYITGKGIQKYTAYTKWWNSDKSKVKRELKLYYTKIDIDHVRLVSKIHTHGYPNKGINQAQFEKEIFPVNKQIVISTGAMPNLFLDNLVNMELNRFSLGNNNYLYFKGDNVYV